MDTCQNRLRLRGGSLAKAKCKMQNEEAAIPRLLHFYLFHFSFFTRPLPQAVLT
jgi:hypothetical protein